MKLLTTKELAAISNRAPRSIVRDIAAGRFPEAQQRGGVWLVPDTPEVRAIAAEPPPRGAPVRKGKIPPLK